MRVLFTRHLPFDTWPLGWWMRELGGALVQAGHEVRGLVAADQPAGDDPFPVSRVICRPGDSSADLDFPPPAFAGRHGSALTFDALDDEQISRYRDAWRRRLDREVDSFNPHVIHTGHLWWDAQLALETGVPYVVSAWSAELTACAGRARWRALVEQAAENASRLFVPHQAMRAAVQATFSIVPDHVAVLPPAVATGPLPARETSRQRWLERFGVPRAVGPLVVARDAGNRDSGLDVLMNAAARCSAATVSQPPGAGPIIAIASSTEADPEWTRQAARLGLDRLHLVEIRRDADWPELWQAADLAVFPHRQPADGLDVLWASAVGTPVIVTAEAGLDWLAGSPAVRTIPGGGHELLAEAMVEALAAPWRATAGKSAIAAATQHQGIAATAGKIADAYRGVLTERFGQLPPR